MATLTTPFWTGGIREHAQTTDNRYQIVMAAAEFNSFYAVSLPVTNKTGTWAQYGVMYKDVRFAQNQAVGTVHWYASVIRYGMIAVVLALIAVVRGRLGREGRSLRRTSPR
jgi:hypothetical protein